MTQPLASQLTGPVLQLVAAIAISQILVKSPLTDLAGEKLRELSEALIEGSKNVIYDTPVIAISAGLTYFFQELAIQRLPSLSLSAQGGTSLKVALCVAGILAVRSALSAYLERVANRESNKDKDADVAETRNLFIRNIVPIAAGCAAAYYAGVPVNIYKTALFTVAVIPVVKILGKIYESVVKNDTANHLGKTISGWVN